MEKGIKISDKEMKQIDIETDESHGDWNYVKKTKLNVIYMNDLFRNSS